MAALADVEVLTELLGRAPTTDFEVVVRGRAGAPVVVRNSPFTIAGLPMPTRFWLVDTTAVAAVSRLEAAGGVKRAQREVDGDSIARAHAAYAAERDAAVAPEHRGPRPHGGVGGTRTGVKC